MDNFQTLSELFSLDFQLMFRHVIHLFFAYLVAFPIGWEREHSERQFGLRTFPLVSVVTCGFMLVGIAVIDSPDGRARVIQGILTGIGFIGGGAIVKNKGSVSGISTATSIWNTGAIGVAAAFDRFEIAIVLALLNVVTLFLFGKVKETVHNDNE